MQFLSGFRVTFLLTVIWLGLVAAGLHFIFRYEATPGTQAQPLLELPASDSIQSSNDRATLLMLLHPHCPCSRASLSELASLMSKVKERVKAQVIFVKPAGVGNGWEQGELWNRAHAIPNVTVTVDEDGQEAAKFGSHTSGQVLLYSTAGSLLFSGGITAGRGHVGPNRSSETIESILLAGKDAAESTMVYGCPLFDESSDLRKGTPECKQR